MSKIIIQRCIIKEEKETIIILTEPVNNKLWFFKSDIEIVEGNCSNCNSLLESRQEQRFHKCTGKCFNCHGFTDIWTHVTNCRHFDTQQQLNQFKAKVMKHDSFTIFREIYNPIRSQFQLYFGYNLAKVYCSMRHGVDIGY